jgi:hypothetical protein
MNTHAIPDAFVFTKVQAYSGQTINQILRRKELERQVGGTFWWGIGESKGRMIRLLAAGVPQPLVIFSLMPTRPHQRDSNPDGVLLWEEYETATGTTAPLPPHVVLCSGAHDKNGRQRSRYFVLVCENPSGIPHSGGGKIDTRTLRNFGDGGKPLDPRQGTAVVETTTRHDKGAPYPITARATLTAPYAVQLAKPRTLSADERKLLNEVSREGATLDDWMLVAKQLRPRTS